MQNVHAVDLMVMDHETRGGCTVTKKIGDWSGGDTSAEHDLVVAQAEQACLSGCLMMPVLSVLASAVVCLSSFLITVSLQPSF